jgi:lipoprotein-anchoring transpeptidase ErfK/SrfK
MAEYYDILRKAVDGLERNDAQARLALYERARQTVMTRQPLLRQDEVDLHLDGVRAAARRIEAEFADEPVPSLRPAAHAQPVERGAPPVAAGAMPARRIGLVAVGVLGAILAAGLSAYYLVARGPGTPQASRSEKAAPAPAPTRREQAKREAEVTPDQASYVLRQQRVYYRTTHPVGSIVVARNQRFLYVVQPNNVAIRYAIGVGRECENVAGLFRVTEKVGGPVAGAAPSAATARFDVPALYFSASQAVHRATDPARVGQSSTDGCFQAWDRDIADLYNRIQLDDRVIVAN